MDPYILLLGVGLSIALLAPLLTGEEIAMQHISVPYALSASGYTESMVTDALMDDLRIINASAAAEVAGVGLNKSRVDESLEELQDYFGVHEIITAVKAALGEIQHHVEGEITAYGPEIVITTRLTTIGDRNAHGEQIVHIAETTGQISQMREMLHEHAIHILDTLSPYVVAVHYYRQEVANREFAFERSRAQLDRFMQRAPVRKHYLAYDLIGRMHRHRAEDMSELTPDQRQAELLEAARWLNASLAQTPDFFYAHVHLGMVYADLGDYDLADVHFAKSVQLNPDDLRTRERWARALAEQGRVREAVFQYVAAVELAPEDSGLRHALAGLYLAAGRPDAARSQWQRAVLLSPMDPTFAERLRALGGPIP